VAAPIQAVGLTAAGLIEVPPLERHNTVGWYDRGPTPGQDGPAVLVGHVDTRSGPSVFAKLGQLKQGDKILVTREDRRLAVFLVDAVRSYPKTDVPADQVYGDFSRPGLRLITCGGDWIGGKTGYADNVVVYASLTDT
jgi:sortase (surface protein transpeptidase)